MKSILALDKLKQEVNLIIGARPSLFYPIMRLRKKYRKVLISAQTEVVIEGFPRSANTFAVAAFEFAQGRKVSIARHTHAPAQIIASVQRKLPTIVLLRKPYDAVTSLVVREPRITLALALKRYIWFYKTILAYKHGYVVACFDEVVSDYSKTINRLNIKFGVCFKLFEHNHDNVQRVFGIIENMERKDAGGMLRETHVARPSSIRNEIKVNLSKDINNNFFKKLLMECNLLYNEFSELLNI